MSPAPALAHTRVRTVLEAPELHNCHDLGVPHGMGVIHEWRNGPTIRVAQREIVVYWYSFSNHRTVCIHYGFSLVGNNLNNTLRTP